MSTKPTERQKVHHRPKVFVSYAADERRRPWLRAFIDALDRHDFEIFSDQQSIRAGDNWREALERALRDADAVVAILGPDTTSKPNVLFEVGAALGMNKRLIPILLEETALTDLPDYLSDRKHLRSEDPERTAELVVAAVAPVS